MVSTTNGGGSSGSGAGALSDELLVSPFPVDGFGSPIDFQIGCGGDVAGVRCV
jgi:hypothetical protein